MKSSLYDSFLYIVDRVDEDSLVKLARIVGYEVEMDSLDEVQFSEECPHFAQFCVGRRLVGTALSTLILLDPEIEDLINSDSVLVECLSAYKRRGDPGTFFLY